MKAGVKKAKTNNPCILSNRFLTLPGVCGKLSRTGQGIIPGRDNFPQSPSNLGASSVRLKNGAGSRNGASLNFGVERIAEIFDRSDGAGVEMRIPGTVLRRHGVNPFDYLKDLFTRLPAAKITGIKQFTPAAWVKVKAMEKLVAQAA